MAPAPGGSASVSDPIDDRPHQGDPDGRRVARRGSQLLAEAGRLARALELLLERAGEDRASAAALTKLISEAESSQLQRAVGHVESRRRFKGGPVRSVAPPDRALLFIDESGRSTPSATDIFALGAVAITGAEAERYRIRANDLKDAFYGHHGLTFHEPHMRRHDGDYYFEGDTAKSAAFDDAVEKVVADTEFTVFGAVIRKSDFAKFIGADIDPYLLPDLYITALQMLLERYIDFRASSSVERTRSKIYIEAQGPREDAEHQRAFADALLHGTQWVPESAFQQWLETGVRFPTKIGSDPTELADMVSRDLYDWVERGCVGPIGRWSLVNDRIYCRGDRAHGKFGVKVFPDADIRDRIEAHRASVKG
jgi:hypothetical protein